MGITFLVLAAFMAAVTRIRPLERPVTLPTQGAIDLEPAPHARWWAAGIVALTGVLDGVFWSPCRQPASGGRSACRISGMGEAGAAPAPRRDPATRASRR